MGEIIDLADYRRFESRLLDQVRLDQPVESSPRYAHYKALTVVGYLRKRAESLAGSDSKMTEYYWGLLLTTLNLLHLDFMREQHREVLLSAAMVCERITQPAW